METWITELLVVALLAGFGGLVRGLIGLWKIYADPKVGSLKSNFRADKFALSILLSACAGLVVFYMKSMPVIEPILTAFQIDLSDNGSFILVGLVGVDILESLLKIFKKT